MIHLYFTSGALHRCCCFLHFNYSSRCHCVTFQGYPKQQAFTPPGTGQRGCKSKEGGWGKIRVEGSIVVCCLSCQCSVWPSCSNYKILIIMMKKRESRHKLEREGWVRARIIWALQQFALSLYHNPSTPTPTLLLPHALPSSVCAGRKNICMLVLVCGVTAAGLASQWVLLPSTPHSSQNTHPRETWKNGGMQEKETEREKRG